MEASENVTVVTSFLQLGPYTVYLDIDTIFIILALYTTTMDLTMKQSRSADFQF